jgi:ABC-type nitrate/sulfonate/bicarbonate transport system substrate-binding protein
MSPSRAVGLVLLSGLLTATVWPVVARDDQDFHAIVPNSSDLDVGVQPWSYPNGVIGSVMRRDRLLKRGLTALGNPLKSYPFQHGADMLQPLADGRLDVALIGDAPATVAASAGSLWIVGLVEVQQNAIVSRDAIGLADLPGKRIGYAPVSTGHTTLMRALGSVKRGLSDVTLLPYAIEEMPDALARGDIDAFAGWEPAVSVALSANPRHHIVFRGQSVDYLVVTRAFERTHPDATLALIAGYVRAINWMRQSSANVEQAARWALADSTAFTGAPIRLSVTQVVAVTRTGILDVPSAPVIIPAPGEPAMKVDYELLRSLGRLPANQRWENVVNSFQYRGLTRVMEQPRKFDLRRFEYETD